jgi:hypothetical protein
VLLQIRRQQQDRQGRVSQMRQHPHPHRSFPPRQSEAEEAAPAVHVDADGASLLQGSGLLLPLWAWKQQVQHLQHSKQLAQAKADRAQPVPAHRG